MIRTARTQTRRADDHAVQTQLIVYLEKVLPPRDRRSGPDQTSYGAGGRQHWITRERIAPHARCFLATAVLDALNRADAERRALETDLARVKVSRRETRVLTCGRSVERSAASPYRACHNPIQTAEVSDTILVSAWGRAYTVRVSLS